MLHGTSSNMLAVINSDDILIQKKVMSCIKCLCTTIYGAVKFFIMFNGRQGSCYEFLMKCVRLTKTGGNGNTASLTLP